MKLSTPQLVAIVAVAAAFVVGAFVLASGGGGGSSTASSGYDPVARCQAASAVSTRSDVLDPTFTGDPTPELINLNKAINEAILVAPDGVGADQARLQTSLASLNQQMAACGYPGVASTN